jgi:site-specific DNA recombinase
MTARAIIYARVSTDEQAERGYSLPTQLEACRRYAQEHGFVVVEEITDDCSGAVPVAERPGGARVYDLLRDGQAKAVVMYTIDRTSRDEREYPIEYLIFLRDVQDADAELHFTDTGKSDGGLVDIFNAWRAAEERRKIRERTMRGRRGKVQAGKVPGNGPAPYGYAIEGHGRDAHLVINEDEAKIVRLIFSLYADEGIGVQEIADRLTDMGVPSRGDKSQVRKKRGHGMWTPGYIYPILKRETYAGTLRVYKYRMVKAVKEDGTNYRRRERRPISEQVGISVPAIIDRATWDKAQARLAEGRQMSKRNSSEHDYLMGRRLTCARCGHNVQGKPCWAKGKVYLYYQCNGKSRAVTSGDCDLPGFRVEHVDATVWAWVKEFLTNPTELAEGMQKFRAERERANAPLRERLRVVDGLLADNRSQLERLLDLYLSGDFSKEMLTERKTRLETAIATLEKERSALTAQLETQIVTTEQAQVFVEFAGTICEGLREAEEVGRETQREFIEKLDARGVLSVENGQKVVHARCVLGESVLKIAGCDSNTL